MPISRRSLVTSSAGSLAMTHRVRAASKQSTPVPSSSARFVFSTVRVRIDEPFDWWLEGCEPGTAVTVRCELGAFPSSAVYDVPEWGIVDPGKMVPVDGDHTSRSPMAAIIHARASGGAWYLPDVTAEEEVTFTALLDDEVAAEGSVVRYAADDCELMIPIEENGFHGSLNHPANASEATPVPVVVVLGGSRGGPCAWRSRERPAGGRGLRGT